MLFIHLPYAKNFNTKKLMNQIGELKYEKAIKKSQLQFKEWLKQILMSLCPKGI